MEDLHTAGRIPFSDYVRFPGVGANVLVSAGAGLRAPHFLQIRTTRSRMLRLISDGWLDRHRGAYTTIGGRLNGLTPRIVGLHNQFLQTAKMPTLKVPLPSGYHAEPQRLAIALMLGGTWIDIFLEELAIPREIEGDLAPQALIWPTLGGLQYRAAARHRSLLGAFRLPERNVRLR